MVGLDGMGWTGMAGQLNDRSVKYGFSVLN